ncbi:uncharacterized protein BJ212DRAFT_768085 [Suillus subaureus]|uniref:Uncharacterized protein n=1 Tax=Suillus subaureus TaxID=48587 RepID=A0A9P7DZJ6_9AGAM|nr:uncharacterized protein BJ212DRAFT_768085 [Suillus subaureus]KAG1807154.1 hypothetical protein BJ212DRAFT_768085 [Suillus subaureus]
MHPATAGIIDDSPKSTAMNVCALRYYQRKRSFDLPWSTPQIQCNHHDSIVLPRTPASINGLSIVFVDLGKFKPDQLGLLVWSKYHHRLYFNIHIERENLNIELKLSCQVPTMQCLACQNAYSRTTSLVSKGCLKGSQLYCKSILQSLWWTEQSMTPDGLIPGTYPTPFPFGIGELKVTKLQIYVTCLDSLRMLTTAPLESGVGGSQ